MGRPPKPTALKVLSGTAAHNPQRINPNEPKPKLLPLTYAFEALGATRVALKTDARNERSQRAIARIGGVREGVLRHHIRLPDGFLRDTVYYSILAEEWPAAKASLEARLHAAARRVESPD